MSTNFLEELLAKLALFVPEFDEPDELSNSPPKIATIHELDIVTDGRKYEFKFTHHFYNLDLRSYAGGLSKLLKDLHDGNFSWGITGGEPHIEWPCSSFLSVGNLEYQYIIYVLNSNRNWQFRHLKAPITISKLAKAKGAYFESRKADIAGNVFTSEKKKDGCRVAYFIADADAAFGQEREYVDRINLHVDMICDVYGKRCFMPIIIDPDVRYPGGSSP